MREAALQLLAFFLAACVPRDSAPARADPAADTDTDTDPETDTAADTADTADTAPPPPITDRFTYARPKVDVLLVVDNSSSMNGKNGTFAEAVEAAVTSWLARGVDFRAGVIDIDANEWHGTLEELDGVRWVDDTLPDPVATLTELVTNVPDYTSDESGRLAIWLALQYAADGQPNAGFLREGAELDILVHSDEDDGTEEPTPEDFVAYLRALRPDPGALHFHAISYGSNYADLADEIGGVAWDVADTPYDPALEAATAMFHRTDLFALTAPPDPATLAVSVGGVALHPALFRHDAAANVVDLDGVPLVEGDEVKVSYLALGP